MQADKLVIGNWYFVRMYADKTRWLQLCGFNGDRAVFGDGGRLVSCHLCEIVSEAPVPQPAGPSLLAICQKLTSDGMLNNLVSALIGAFIYWLIYGGRN